MRPHAPPPPHEVNFSSFLKTAYTERLRKFPFPSGGAFRPFLFIRKKPFEQRIFYDGVSGFAGKVPSRYPPAAARPGGET
jgi:hypothetical protein